MQHLSDCLKALGVAGGMRQGYEQFLKCLFQFKQPAAQLVALHGLAGLRVGIFGQRFQPLPAHVCPTACAFCGLNLVVTTCIRL